jgi:colanic acid/amylovoran biosynthesis glycosyltransferase
MANTRDGSLLLVVPPVVRTVNGIYEVETDFSHNLRLYLTNFSRVTFACPPFPDHDGKGAILHSLPVKDLQNSARLTFVPLPYPYREDRYLRHYLTIRRLLSSEIANAQYLLFSPHSKYDWSTLAAFLAIKQKRKYDMESDHDHRSAQQFLLESLPFGVNKLRKTLWARSFLKNVEHCFSHSAVALLQGQEVFDACKSIAPNPHKVLNVQVSPDDHISAVQLEAKVDRVEKKAPLTVSYAGQAIARKGPFDWLRVVRDVSEAGTKVQATWFGDGPLLEQMKREAKSLDIHDIVSFPGSVSRTEIMAALQKTDIFLFCHKIGESPRCLGEALAAGCALVGYGTEYPRELVAKKGGGEFAGMDDWHSLAEKIISLDEDRIRLTRLLKAAASSGRLLDRDVFMQKRIDLIKAFG